MKPMKVEDLLAILQDANPKEHIMVKTKHGYYEVVEATRHSLPGSYIADIILYTEPA